MRSSPPSDARLDELLRIMAASYKHLTGKSLIEDFPSEVGALREALWNAPRGIVAHGTEADPVFFYGNRLALQLFEMSFEEFTCLPSRLSADSEGQAVRAELLEKVSRQGFVDGYSGMRIAQSGRRFRITDATVWNLVDEAGVRQGQAAVFIESNLI